MRTHGLESRNDKWTLNLNLIETAVASFFTPSSQKPPEKITWQERAPAEDAPNSLVVGKYQPVKDSAKDQPKIGGDIKRHKIAAFDFVSWTSAPPRARLLTCHATIRTQLLYRRLQERSLQPMPTIGSGGIRLFLPLCGNCTWKMGTWKQYGALKAACRSSLHSFRVVVLSNQGGISLKPDTKAPKSNVSKLSSFKTKVLAVFGQLDIPISIYAATGKDMYRKPRTGMWVELLEDYGISPDDLDIDNSLFVGDAGGRDAFNGHPKDFSCSDRCVFYTSTRGLYNVYRNSLTRGRNFAHNVGIKFLTPEEYFLGEAPRPFTRTFDPNEYIKVSADEST